MGNKKIITICRQFHSGGLETGKKLSKKLGFKFYDKELISLAAKESGFTEDLFENADEKASRSFLFSIAMGMPIMAGGFLQDNNFLSNDKLFGIQSKVIKDVSKEDSVVIVGRCSDYILREEPNLVRVFLRADNEFRTKRMLEQNDTIDQNDSSNILRKIDKSRSNYYEYYTGNTWENLDNYDLVINTGKIGIDKAVEQIIQYVNSI